MGNGHATAGKSSKKLSNQRHFWAVLDFKSIVHRLPSIELFAQSPPASASSSSLNPISRVG